MSNQDAKTSTGGTNTPHGPNPSGCRTAWPEHHRARESVRSWTGLEGGLDHWAILCMLECGPVADKFGLRHRHLSYLRCVFRKLQSMDFKPGPWAPVVWMTKLQIANHLGIRPRAVSNLENELASTGLLYWTDAANRRRDGCRDKDTGRIASAYGVNFAPFACMAPDIEAAFKEVKREANEHFALVREIASIRCRTIICLKALSTRSVANDSMASELLAQARGLPTGRTMSGKPLTDLRRLVDDARSIDLRTAALAEPRPTGSRPSSDAASLQAGLPENCTPGCTDESGPITITNQYQDNNLAAADPTPAPSPEHNTPAARQWPERGECSRAEPSDAAAAKFPPAWLILESLPASFACHLPDAAASEDDFLMAANLTRSRLGISPAAWREAGEVLGPQVAPLAIAVIASRADAGEVRSAGGYLRGMISAARKGKLQLGRSLWGLVDRASGPDPRPGPDGPETVTVDPDPSVAVSELRPGARSARRPPSSDRDLPALQHLSEILPAPLRARILHGDTGDATWLALYQEVRAFCIEELALPDPAWAGALETIGWQATAVAGVLTAVVSLAPGECGDPTMESVFMHLVIDETSRPGTLVRRAGELSSAPATPTHQTSARRAGDAS